MEMSLEELLSKIKTHLYDEGLNKHKKLYNEIENYLKTRLTDET